MGCQLEDENECFDPDAEDQEIVEFEMLETSFFLNMDDFNHESMQRTILDSRNNHDLSMDYLQRSDVYFMNSNV